MQDALEHSETVMTTIDSSRPQQATLLGGLIRLVAGVGAMLLAQNGVSMLAMPADWYASVPGVSETGPYNGHFVRDIGIAYLTTAAAFAWGAWRPRPLVFCFATLFLGLHAGLHLAEYVAHGLPSTHLGTDLAGIFLPPAIAATLALFTHIRNKETLS